MSPKGRRSQGWSSRELLLWQEWLEVSKICGSLVVVEKLMSVMWLREFLSFGCFIVLVRVRGRACVTSAGYECRESRGDSAGDDYTFPH